MDFRHLQVEQSKKSMFTQDRSQQPTEAKFENEKDQLPPFKSTVDGTKTCTQSFHETLKVIYTWSGSCWIRMLINVAKPSQLIQPKWNLLIESISSDGGKKIRIELSPQEGTLTDGKFYVTQLAARFENTPLDTDHVNEKCLGYRHDKKMELLIGFPLKADTPLFFTIAFNKYK